VNQVGVGAFAAPRVPSKAPTAPIIELTNMPELAVEIRQPSKHEELWEFLRIAAHEEDIEVVKSSPALTRYVKGFDPANDFGLVAFLPSNDDDPKKSPIGAAWVRFWSDPLFRGYGHVRDDIPELAIGVSPKHQGKGIGSQLMTQLLKTLEMKDIPGTSLSVRDDNAALQLYERLGFQRVPGTEVQNRVGGCSFTMQCLFGDEDATINGFIVLREAITEKDIPIVFDLLEQKAAYDKTMMSDEASITEFTVSVKKLKAALLDGEPKVASVILAEELGEDGESKVIGMALYYHRFSSFRGQSSVWLEDIFIVPTRRGNGAGMILMQRLKEIAIQNDCTHVGWTASSRNERGLQFYTQKIGAKIMDEGAAGSGDRTDDAHHPQRRIPRVCLATAEVSRSSGSARRRLLSN
jgi:ribosomal protein S18 acetylase RimI-like enzyme